MSLSSNQKRDETTASETRIFRCPEDREVQALIATEERIGKEKMQLRREKQRLKNDAAMNTAQDEESTQENEASEKSSSTNTRAPQVYNGPCVICLEPDPDSREKLQALRYLLQHTLPPWVRRCAELYSPTGTFPSHHHPRHPPRRRNRRRPSQQNDDPADDFRPTVPMAAFETITSAIPVARRLRQQ